MVRSEKSIRANFFSPLKGNLNENGRFVKNVCRFPRYPFSACLFAVSLLGEVLQAIRRALYLLDDEISFLLKMVIDKNTITQNQRTP